MTISVFLYFFSASIILGYNVLIFTKNVQNQFTLKIYLDPTLKEKQLQQLLKRIQGMESIQSVEYVSPDEGLNQLSLFLNTNLKSILKTNPLPGLFKCKLHEYYLSTEDVKKVSRKIRDLKGVLSIEFPFEKLKILESYGLPIGLISILMMILIFFVSVVLVHFTIRVVIEGRQKEILLTRLLGGTHFYIRFPLLVEGIAVGLISSCIVIVLIHMTRMISSALDFHLFREWDLLYLGVLGTGILMGILGSQIAVKKFLYMDEEML